MADARLLAVRLPVARSGVQDHEGTAMIPHARRRRRYPKLLPKPIQPGNYDVSLRQIQRKGDRIEIVFRVLQTKSLHRWSV